VFAVLCVQARAGSSEQRSLGMCMCTYLPHAIGSMALYCMQLLGEAGTWRACPAVRSGIACTEPQLRRPCLVTALVL
jgi:hypothetical protein